MTKYRIISDLLQSNILMDIKTKKYKKLRLSNKIINILQYKQKWHILLFQYYYISVLGTFIGYKIGKALLHTNKHIQGAALKGMVFIKSLEF